MEFSIDELFVIIGQQHYELRKMIVRIQQMEREINELKNQLTTNENPIPR